MESQFVPEDYVRSTVRDTTEERINSVNQQLHSRSFLERIIEDFRLYGFGNQEFVMETAVDADAQPNGDQSGRGTRLSSLISRPSHIKLVM